MSMTGPAPTIARTRPRKKLSYLGSTGLSFCQPLLCPLSHVSFGVACPETPPARCNFETFRSTEKVKTGEVTFDTRPLFVRNTSLRYSVVGSFSQHVRPSRIILTRNCIPQRIGCPGQQHPTQRQLRVATAVLCSAANQSRHSAHTTPVCGLKNGIHAANCRYVCPRAPKFAVLQCPLRLSTPECRGHERTECSQPCGELERLVDPVDLLIARRATLDRPFNTAGLPCRG